MSEPLESFASAYLDEVVRMAPADLQRVQPAPFASLGHGAAGLALLCLRAFRATGQAHFLDCADRWSTAAWEMRDEPDACRGKSFTGHPSSILFGHAGLAFVEVLVARATRSSRTSERLMQFVALCGERPDASFDFLQGSAGQLHAVATLHAEAPDERLAELGDRIARSLAGRALSSEDPAFAVGAAGVVAGILGWSLASGCALPASVLADVETVGRTPIRGTPAMMKSWCNGSAGIVLALVDALRHAPSHPLLVLARSHGRHIALEDAAAASLCCGLAGRAYALLALAAIDDESDWRSRAMELAHRALGRTSSVHPHGLFRGTAGLVHLAIDMTSDLPAQFPIVGH